MTTFPYHSACYLFHIFDLVIQKYNDDRKTCCLYLAHSWATALHKKPLQCFEKTDLLKIVLLTVYIF